MRTTPYHNIPLKDAWVNDSRVGDIRVRRSQDPVLIRIDKLLKDMESAHDGGEINYLHCELYFASNYWLRNYLATTGMCNDREPAVRMLRDIVEAQLANTFNCGRQLVRPRLQKYYAKTITAHGVWCDKKISYLPMARREKFRLVFENGKAYWVEWWRADSKRAVKLRPVNTKMARDRTHVEKTGDGKLQNLTGLREDWAFFALSFDRDIYIGPHRGATVAESMPVFHSSYLRGMPVQFAGSIHVENGKVLGIRNDSGHYQPNDKFFVNILAQLKTVGVNLKRVVLYDHENKRILRDTGEPYRADHYLEETGKWEMVLDRGAEYLLDQTALRIALGRKKVFNRIYRGDTSVRQQSDVVTMRNLSNLAEEQYDLRVRDGERAGPDLWINTWVRICNAIIELMPIDDRMLLRYRRAWEDRMRNPAKPPRPKRWPPPLDRS